MSNLPVPADPADIERVLNAWLLYPQSGNTNTTYADAFRRIQVATWAIPQVNEEKAMLIIKRLYTEYADNTVALTVRAMSSLWKRLLRAGLVAANPWADQDIREPEDKRAVRYLRPPERDALIAAADAYNLRDGIFCRFLYYSLLRVSTAISVPWRALRPDENDEWAFITARSKGDKTGTTKVPLRLFTGWIDPDGGEHLGLFDIVGRRNIDPDALIFPFSRRRAHTIVSGAGERAGLGKGVSPHWLRHTGATDALRGGVDLKTLQENLFHARMDTTAIYLHVEPGHTAGDHMPEV